MIRKLSASPCGMKSRTLFAEELNWGCDIGVPAGVFKLTS